MVAADPNAGVIYICNPNNPTGTLTPARGHRMGAREQAEGLHPAAGRSLPALLRATPTPIWWRRTRTSSSCARSRSSIGMAGLRAGAAIGRPDLLAKMQTYSRRRAADHRHGGRGHQPQGEDAGAGAPQEHARHPRRTRSSSSRRTTSTSSRRTATASCSIPRARPRSYMDAMAKENVYVGRTLAHDAHLEPYHCRHRGRNEEIPGQPPRKFWRKRFAITAGGVSPPASISHAQSHASRDTRGMRSAGISSAASSPR